MARLVNKKRGRSRQEKFDAPFPLPQDVQNLTRTTETDQFNFQTTLSLREIAEFYRREFTAQGLAELELVASIDDTCMNLAFTGLPDEKKVVVQAVDLENSSNVGMRNVNIRTEGDGKNSEEPCRTGDAVSVGAVDIILGMTGIALEKAGYSNAPELIKESLAAECTVCGLKISGADIVSEQRWLQKSWAKQGVVLHRGPDALDWTSLEENRCVKPGCISTTYRVSWTDPETRRIFDSVLSRYDWSVPYVNRTVGARGKRV